MGRDLYPVGRGRADDAADRSEKMGDQPDRRRLPVGPGNDRERDPPLPFVAEKHVDDGDGDLPGLPLHRGKMHAKTGSRVHLDDCPAIPQDRSLERRGDDVDSNDVQIDEAADPFRHEAVRRMHRVRDILRHPSRREIRGRLQTDNPALLRDRIQVEPTLP